MARKIVQESETGSTHLGGRVLPQTQEPFPTTTPHLLYDTGSLSSAGVEYHSKIANQGVRELESLSVQFENQYITSECVKGKASAFAAGQEYLLQNPRGDGYNKHVMGVYEQSMKQSMSDAPSSRSRRVLQQHFQTGALSLEESSLNKELETGARYSMAETDSHLEQLKSQTYLDPRTTAENLALYELSLSSMQPYLKEKFGAYKNEKLGEFWNVAVRGDINIDPLKTKERLENNHYSKISAEDRIRLMQVATSTHEAREHRAHVLYERSEREKLRRDMSITIRAEQLMAQGKLDEEIIDKLPFEHEDSREKLRTDFFSNQGKISKRETVQTDLSRDIKENRTLTEYTASEIATNYVAAKENMASEKVNPVTGSPIETTPIDDAVLVLKYKTDKPIAPYTADMTTLLEYGDPEKAYLAALSVNTVNEINPNVIKGMDERYKAYASQVARRASLASGEDKASHINKIVKETRELLLRGRTAADYASAQEAYKQYMKTDHDAFDYQLEKSFSDSFWFNRLNRNVRITLYADGRQALKTAFYAGLRDRDAQSYAMEILKNQYGVTKLNSKGGEFASYPAEKAYPHLSEAQLKNQMAYYVERLVKADKSGDVGLEKRLISEELKTANDVMRATTLRTTTEHPTIKAKINGKWEPRQVYIENARGYHNKYRLYWLREEGNYMTKNYLGSNTMIDFE